MNNKMSDEKQNSKIPNRSIKIPTYKKYFQEPDEPSESAYISKNNLNRKSIFNNLSISSGNGKSTSNDKNENKFLNFSNNNSKNNCIPSPFIIHDKNKYHEPISNNFNKSKVVHVEEVKTNNNFNQPSVKNLNLQKIHHVSLNSLFYKNGLQHNTSTSKLSFNKSGYQINKLIINKDKVETNKQDESFSNKKILINSKKNGVKNISTSKTTNLIKLDNSSDNNAFDSTEVQTGNEFVQLDIESFNQMHTEILILKSTISKLYSLLDNLNIDVNSEGINTTQNLQEKNQIKIFNSDNYCNQKLTTLHIENFDKKNFVIQQNKSIQTEDWQSNKLNCCPKTSLTTSLEDEDLSASINSNLNFLPIESSDVNLNFDVTSCKLNELQILSSRFNKLDENLLNCDIKNRGSDTLYAKLDDQTNIANNYSNYNEYISDHNIFVDKINNNCKMSDAQLYIKEKDINNISDNNSNKNLIENTLDFNNDNKNEKNYPDVSLHKSKPVKFISKLPLFARSKEN